jgi:hypothetical protein
MTCPFACQSHHSIRFCPPLSLTSVHHLHLTTGYQAAMPMPTSSVPHPFFAQLLSAGSGNQLQATTAASAGKQQLRLYSGTGVLGQHHLAWLA